MNNNNEKQLKNWIPSSFQNAGFDFSTINDIKKKEVELKSIPGVVEVGIFTRHADVYYKANTDGAFETIEL
ncbi:MAG TPA: ribose-5-phosphate isomerase A [Nitrososphaeraceae archaeon]|jgi:ribose 5-phosphate isomerase|nr:ribose-5-phosphate isomerase A [Nitrososphaeraceae archaeon]